MDCHKVALWLENNQHRFEKHVFGPVCLEINVRDQQYVDAIEFGLGGVGSNEMKVLTKFEYIPILAHFFFLGGFELIHLILLFVDVRMSNTTGLQIVHGGAD